MTEWTEEQMMDQGYFLDKDEAGEPNAVDRRVNENAAHRESMLPSSRSAGQPLADKEVPEPRTETDRLFPDSEQARRVLEARKAAGL